MDYQRMTYSDLIRPTPEVLKRVFEDLLDRVVVEDGQVTRREDQLDQLCNVILLKLQSDKLARLDANEAPRFRILENPTQTGSAIRQQFHDLVREFPDTFVTQQEREIRFQDRTIFRCVHALQSYRLLETGIETITLAFQVLRSAALRAAEGQYFTPYPVVKAGVELLQIDPTDLVVDPACGTGGFLLEVLLSIGRRAAAGDREMVSRWAQTHLYGVDKDGIAVKLTKAMMQIAGDGSAHVVRGDSVRTHLWETDFPYMVQPFKSERFSVVVTNPPFGQNLKVSADDLRQMDSVLARQGSGWRDLEIGLVFLERAYDLLKPGGRLGIVLPETYFFSPSYHFVFEWLRPRFRPVAVVNIPMEAFQGFCRAKTNFYVFVKRGEEPHA